MEYTIDCAGIVDRKELHRLLAETLSFPHWYGHNLDALYDCLTAISTPTHLIWHIGIPPPLISGFLKWC